MIMICPICGNTLIGYLLDFIDDDFVKTGIGFCSHCEKQIIPLVTPKEEK